MDRRGLLRALLAAPLAGVSWIAYAQKKGMAMVEELQQNWKMFLAAGVATPSPEEPLNLSKDEWRKRLSAAAFKVMREEGTERAGTSPLDREKREGVFVCAGCDLPVYTSAMKFDSGTGWPSFFTHLPHAVGTKRDFKLILPRTEYHCARCGGHQGHVFDDGPKPTGQRWCNNGLALVFVPRGTPLPDLVS